MIRLQEGCTISLSVEATFLDSFVISKHLDALWTIGCEVIRLLSLLPPYLHVVHIRAFVRRVHEKVQMGNLVEYGITAGRDFGNSRDRFGTIESSFWQYRSHSPSRASY